MIRKVTPIITSSQSYTPNATGYAISNISGAVPGYFASLNEMRIRVLLLLVILFVFVSCMIFLFCGYQKKKDIGTRAIDRELNRKALESQPEQNAYVKIEITKPT